MPYVAIGAVVKVSVGSASGNRIAHIVRSGDVLPEGVDSDVIARLEKLGLISELESAEEVAALIEIERQVHETERELEFEARVQQAAQSRVIELQAEFDGKVEAEVNRLVAEATTPAIAPKAAAVKPAGK